MPGHRVLRTMYELRAAIAPEITYIIYAICLYWFILAPHAAAQQPGDIGIQFNAHLQAGEFGPALALARKVADPRARDRLLAAVAQAQVRGGARQAGLNALGEMSDDRNRSQALSDLSSQPAESWPARGGGAQADFDTLIDLIRSTVAPQSWDAVGGPGAIDRFPGGVYVDTAGLMKRLPLRDGGRDLASLRQRSWESSGNRDVRSKAVLRKISLTRLEREVQLRRAFGKQPTAAMQMLAGLQRVKYVFVYPENGDVVIAGPAGEWKTDGEGRQVSVDGNVPVLHLDDFVVVLRNAKEHGGKFTCSITPRRENLAAAQAFLNESAKRPLKPEQRTTWLAQVRERVGKQLIEVEGLDPRTRVARIIVEADYRMKLVGMGLEEGVHGLTSYLDSIEVPAGSAPPPMSVLRWWFTMNYNALQATPTRNAFELQGQGVKVLSENEMLDERGERIHTGTADELNEQFAHGFTKHFAALAIKYPIYAELRNVFDLALVAGLCGAEDLPTQVNWHLTHFLDPQRYQVELGVAPTEVETVINHRVIRQKHIVAGVSGGVSADASPYLERAKLKTDDYGALEAEYVGSVPKDLPRDAWWWD
ncbi:MAG: DUF1598 domain-containing protein [Planctomycetota bacterium]|nr:DUF1598 domain-containing protein [Planctomycetota bacterium]